MATTMQVVMITMELPAWVKQEISANKCLVLFPPSSLYSKNNSIKEHSQIKLNSNRTRQLQIQIIFRI